MVRQTSLEGLFTFFLDRIEKIFQKDRRNYTAHAIKNDLGDKGHMQSFTALPKFLSLDQHIHN